MTTLMLKKKKKKHGGFMIDREIERYLASRESAKNGQPKV
jgi:hypothetical protein